MIYHLLLKQRPKLEKYGIIGTGILFIVGPIIMPGLTASAEPRYSLEIYGLIMMIIGGGILWASFNNRFEFNLNRSIASIDFQCNECDHKWNVVTKKSTWEELPSTEWKTYLKNSRIPGLENQ